MHERATTSTAPRGRAFPRRPGPARGGTSLLRPTEAQLLRLQRTAGNAALGRALAHHGSASVATVQRAGETVDVALTWRRTAPRKFSQKVLDDHGVDWSADVFVNGRRAGSGDGSITLELVKGRRHSIRVVPTAMLAADGTDYFTAGTTKVVATGAPVHVTLRYNRWNKRFTRASWADKGLDPALVGRTVSTSMFGRKVVVNTLVTGTVDRTNAYFEGPALTDAERDEVRASIVSLGGYASRTTTAGGYSNHSTGCAVDINAFTPTKQNFHWKKKRKDDARLMKLFARVVRLDPAWTGYDPWTERDATRILGASAQFNAAFPRHLSGLLDDALGREWLATRTGTAATAERLQSLMPLPLSVLRAVVDAATKISPEVLSKVDPALLATAAKAASKSGKADTAAALRAIRRDWPILRAWVEGIVVYGDGEWAYASEHRASGTGKKVRGALQGMVSLHPKLVESLLKGGWTWLVDYRHDNEKDFMHFEDRTAEKALRRT